MRLLKHMALMLQQGASARGHGIEVVVSCQHGAYDLTEDFRELRDRGIQVRPTRWRQISVADGEKVLRESGCDKPAVKSRTHYVLPSDGHNDFLDCDDWLFVSDRVPAPVLPIRPYGVYVADCLQRYVPECFSRQFAEIQSNVVLPFLRTAQYLLATTPSTVGDLNAYAGVARDRIVRIPMFIDSTLHRSPSKPVEGPSYFLWVTNLAPHKNHSRVVLALRKYYERGGQLDCVIVGTLTDALRPDSAPPSEGLLDYIERIKRELHASSNVSSHLRIAGELSDRDYCRTLQGAKFLLQANLYDNGCFATVDAACLGVPSLCAGYPAQDFINQTFRLDALRFDPHDAESLADGLLRMETGASQRSLPPREHLDQFDWQTLAPQFYETILSRLSPIHAQLRDAYR